jgi:hypothetical protein
MSIKKGCAAWNLLFAGKIALLADLRHDCLTYRTLWLQDIGGIEQWTLKNYHS